MRQTALAVVLVATGLNAAYAKGDFTVIGGVDFAFKTLRLDVQRQGDTFAPSYVTINPIVGLSYKSFYATASYERSLTTSSGYDQVPGSGGLPVVSNLDFARTDAAFTVGYRLGSGFSVFAGYTKGVNDFVETVYDSTMTSVTNIEYSTTGPFAGAAYTRSFGKKGNLGLSVGYAKLDGELNFERLPGPFSFRDEGETTGLSYTLTWSGPLTGSLGYRVGAKATSYEMKEPSNVKEEYSSIFLGIVNYF